MNDELARVAQNLARNCGYAVFPCLSRPGNKEIDKKPATPHGFKDASHDPNRIAELWRRYPGPLIGIATGDVSGIAVLDVDVAHDDARAWWHANESRLPVTRTFRTRSGGIHLYFTHAQGVGVLAGKPIKGVDVRGTGGYIIFWYAIGCACNQAAYGLTDCLDHAPTAPWPNWLTDFFWPPQPKQSTRRPFDTATNHDGANHAAAINGLSRTVREAPKGSRNQLLNWSAYHLHKRVAAGQISEAEARRDVLAAALQAGLSETEASRTIASAWSAA